MTPKETANEIYEWMKDSIPFPDYYTEEQYLRHVIFTSIEHIERVQNALGTKCSECQDEQYSALAYWTEVKQEIEKL